MQSLTRRPMLALAPAVPARRSPAVLCVAVVADDPRLVTRVGNAMRREGVAGRVQAGGATRLRADGLERPPDVVVLGGADPHACIAEAARVRRRLGAVHVVVVLDADASCNVRRLIEAGVDGVVLEPELEDTVGLVIRTVCAGHISLPRSMRHGVDPPVFSEREREIFRLVLAGLTNAEIADREYLSRSTVAGRLTRIFRQLGVRSRREAVSLVLGPDESLRENLVGGGPDSAAAALIAGER